MQRRPLSHPTRHPPRYSYDTEPVEPAEQTSLFETDETDDSSAYTRSSFDENTEAYREPKFDDLRKPGPGPTAL